METSANSIHAWGYIHSQGMDPYSQTHRKEPLVPTANDM